MATTPTPTSALRVALDRIRVPENVRALDPAHVDALAGSIRLQGLIVPLVVHPTTPTTVPLPARAGSSSWPAFTASPPPTPSA
jgi:hypothetical protein